MDILSQEVAAWQAKEIAWKPKLTGSSRPLMRIKLKRLYPSLDR